MEDTFDKNYIDVVLKDVIRDLNELDVEISEEIASKIKESLKRVARNEFDRLSDAVKEAVKNELDPDGKKTMTHKDLADMIEKIRSAEKAQGGWAQNPWGGLHPRDNIYWTSTTGDSTEVKYDSSTAKDINIYSDSAGNLST